MFLTDLGQPQAGGLGMNINLGGTGVGQTGGIQMGQPGMTRVSYIVHIQLYYIYIDLLP